MTSEAERQRRRSKTILFAEDDAQMRKFIQAVLDEAGFTVIGTATGEQCLAKLTIIKPVAILLDIDMPGGMNGFETCMRIREAAPDLNCPIIFVTGRKTTEDVLAARKLGAAHFVAKPLTPEKLIDKVVAALGAQRSQSRSPV